MPFHLIERPYSAPVYDPWSESLWPSSWHAQQGSNSLFDSVWPSAASMLQSINEDGFSRGSMILRHDKDHNEYVVEAPTPGVRREEIKIDVVGGRRVELSIDQGTPMETDGKKDSQETGTRYARRAFMSVTLPQDADANAARLDYTDGLLRMHFPRVKQDQDAANTMRVEGEHAELAKEAAARMDKVKELRAMLEAEAKEAAKAQDRLADARREAARKAASERKPLSF